MMNSMMRPPPPPARRSDPSTAHRQPTHPSFPEPQRPTSEMYHPSRSCSSTGYFPPGPSHSSQYRPPIISPIPRPDSRAPAHPFQALVSTQPMPETAGKEEEEGAYESYQSSLPEAQPLHHTSFSQLYTQPSSQSQPQSNHILVQETHVPRRPPRAQTSVDLLGGFSPPTSSIPLPPPRQRTQSETVIPETRPESQSQSQDEGSQTGPPKRVDTYRPEPPSRPAETRRPANVWQMGMEGGGQAVPGRRAATSMGRPASSMGAARQEGRGAAGVGGRGAAELFMASTQQQGGGGSKTASEKIMDALSDWSTQILDVVAELKADQKKVRDQVHEVQTGQRALATREEVVEEITAQLSPALHEFFKTLHAKIDSSVKPLPEETAKLASEEMRRIVMEIEQFKASQRSQDDSSEKPMTKLLDHLISKLDAVSHISDFLHGCKDLPDALRDMVIYKQSMDVLTAMTKNAPPPAPAQPPAQLPPAQIDTTVLRGLQQAMEDLANQFHQHASATIAAAEDTRVMNAIHTLAKGLDSLPIHQPPPPPPPPPPQAEAVPLVEPPQLSRDMLQLRGKVDTLSTDIRDIKALLAQQRAHPPLPPPPPPQPAVDVADIVAHLKAALPSLIAELQPAAAVSTPPQQSGIHPPQLLPPPADNEYAQPGPEDYSQLQPTEVGNSQSQTAQFYPTPRFNFRDRSSTTIQALTQPSSEISRSASNAEYTQTLCDIEPPATAPPVAVPTFPTPSSSSAITIAGFSTQPSLKLRPDGTFGRVPPPPSDVFGQIQPTAAPVPVAPAPAAELPTPPAVPALGTGNLGVSEAIDDDLESLDEYEDIINKARQTGPSKPSLPPKGRGKRSASNSGSTPSSAKRARTRTSAASTTPLPTIPSSPRPKSHKKKPVAPSATTRVSSDSSPEIPVPIPAGGSGSLLDPSSIPGGGVLKRSPRLVAVRTESSDPMYNSDLPSERKRSSGSKAVKQELIDAADMAPAGTSTGPGSAAQPISFEDSSADSLDGFFDRSRRTRSQAVPAREDTDSLSSRTSKRTSSRLAKASSSEVADRAGPSKVPKAGSAGGKGTQNQPEESLFCTPRDPAPMARTSTYGRRNRVANVSFGGDDSDADDAL